MWPEYQVTARSKTEYKLGVSDRLSQDRTAGREVKVAVGIQ